MIASGIRSYPLSDGGFLYDGNAKFLPVRLLSENRLCQIALGTLRDVVLRN